MVLNSTGLAVSNIYHSAQNAKRELPILSEKSFTALRLYNSIPEQIDRDTRVLAVGPYTPDWTQNPAPSWRKRYRHLRNSLPTYKKYFDLRSGTVTKDSKKKNVVNIETINRQTRDDLASNMLSIVEKPPKPIIVRNGEAQSASHGMVHFQLSHEQPTLSDEEGLVTLEPFAVIPPPEHTSIDGSSMLSYTTGAQRPMSVQWDTLSVVNKDERLAEISPEPESIAMYPSYSRHSAISSGVASFVTAMDHRAAGSEISEYESATSSASESESESESETEEGRTFSLNPSLFGRSSWENSLLADNRSVVQETIHTMKTVNPNPSERAIDKGLSNFLARKQFGEIIAAEKLLVMVKASKAQYVSPQFNEVEQIETRVLERWKEYVMVARNTGNNQAPILLQFYDTRYIAKVEKNMAKSISKIDTLLTSDMQVKFYSTLDKTIVFWKSSDKGTLFYILRARSHALSLRWLALFLRTLGIRKTPILTLGIPHLGFTIQAILPLKMIQQEQEKVLNARQRGAKKLSYRDMRSNAAEAASPLMIYLFGITVKLFNSCGYTKQDILKIIGKNKLGLAWRRYDRLEWLDETNEEALYYNWVLESTHDLEIRLKKPYSSFVTLDDQTEMEEPVPIEGYLMRLTTWTGQVKRNRGHLNKLFFKTLYFHTHDNLMFFSKTSHALPPCPSTEDAIKLISSETGLSVEQDEECQLHKVYQDAPLVYNVAPYKTNKEGEIEWLCGNDDPDDVMRHDIAALYEMERRVSILGTSEGFLDLCEIVSINTVTDGGANNDLPLFASPPLKFDTEGMFELTMSTGRIIRLQAYNKTTRDVWIKRLEELSTYWKRRVFEDVARMHEVRQMNLERLNFDREEDGVDPFLLDAPKWETTSNSVADANMFPGGGNALSRSITLNGTLYQKPKKHASFRKYHVVLCQGQLLLFSVYDRTVSGKIKERVDHRRYKSIDLSDSSCYVYSGPITEADMLKGRDKSFDAQNPGSHFIPRVYADGWKSNEDEGFRCFVLWFGKKRPIKNHAKKSQKLKLRLANRLGVSGTSMVFLTRSRQERDLWVLALNQEIERVAEGATQDIQINA